MVEKKRVFYKYAWVYFLLAMIVILAGFIPSFFSELSNTDTWHHIHGISATLWLLLLVIQPWLYANGKLDFHRKLGKLSFLLVPMLTIGGIRMIQIMIQRRDEYPPLEAFRLSFLDTISLFFFILFFGLAIYYRKHTAYHARYMAATVLLLVPPGLTRLLFNLSLADNFTSGLHICFILLDITVLLLLADDRNKTGLSKPYLQLAAVILGLHLSLPFVSNWDWWQKLSVAIFG